VRKSLYNAIMSRPELFTELLCLLYRPAHGTVLEGCRIRRGSQLRLRASTHHCAAAGSLPDGTVDGRRLYDSLMTPGALSRVDRLAAATGLSVRSWRTRQPTPKEFGLSNRRGVFSTGVNWRICDVAS